ncbi:MAG: hypothetical protein KAS32_28370 [Candidatus Peribacteraceae bacterium]|nr:hypothetical protein [Candidatus Peribacteraceae bacterium]
MGSIADQFKKLKKDSVRRSASRSSAWLRNKMRGDGIDKKMMTNKPMLGKMYLFQYDPKHKATLPYYDKNPLVIVIGHYSDGFLGLNLHYLPPKLRLLLLDKLEGFASGKMPMRKKFRVTYELLKASARMKMFQPTLHRYLYSHKKTKFSLIPADEWEYVVMLPLAKFKGKSNQGVYSASRKMY